MLHDQPRIAVIGTSASGKSTFARQLSALLGHPHIELDALHWGPNWTPRDDFPDRLRDAVASESWVTDGNYSKVRDIVWGRATAVVWLNYPFHFVFRRALSRTVSRIISRQRVYAGNQESIRGAFLNPDGIPYWVIRTHHKNAREYPRAFREPRFRHLTVFELKTHAECVRMLESTAGRGSPSLPPRSL